MKEYGIAKKVLPKNFHTEGVIFSNSIRDLAILYTGPKPEERKTKKTKKESKLFERIQARPGPGFGVFEKVDVNNVSLYKIIQKYESKQKEETMEMSYNLYDVVEAVFENGRYFCREQPEPQYEKIMMAEPLWNSGSIVRNCIGTPRQRETAHSRIVGHTLGVDLELPHKLIKGYLVLMDAPEQKRKYEQLAVIMHSAWESPQKPDWNMHVLGLSDDAENPIYMGALALPSLRLGKCKNLTGKGAIKALKNELNL